MDLGLIFIILIFLFSVILHEVAHGYAADAMGDPTPRLAGRLSLNPLRHLDFFGSFLLPLFLIISRAGFVFGWAKPVPINPYNFNDQKYGRLKVGVAGVSVNFLLAFLFGLPIRFLPQNILFFKNLTTFFGYIVAVNLVLGIFNLFPLPPFDGSHIVTNFFPSFERKIMGNPGLQIVSMFLAVFFLMFIGFPYIIQPLFKLITGISILGL